MSPAGPGTPPPPKRALGDRGLAGAAGDLLESAVESRATERQRQTLQVRLVRLQEITAALAAARTPEQVLDVVLSQVVDGVGASSASAALLDDDGRTLEVAAAVGYGASLIEQYASFGIDSPRPLAVATRTGQPVVHDAAGSDGEPGQCESDGPKRGACAALPLRTDERALGALDLRFEGPRALDEAEVAFLQAVANQCAQSLERSRLHKDEAAARARAEASQERLEFLAEVSNVLASTLDPQPTIANIAELVVPRLGDWCVITLLQGGRLFPAAVTHVDGSKSRLLRFIAERWPPRLDARTGAGAVARTGKPELHRRFSERLLDEIADSEEHRQALRELGLSSSLIVPLRARGRTIGTMTIANQGVRHADETDLALAEETATRAAVGIDNARMFAERSHASKSLQESLLPPRLPDVPGVDVGASYQAAGTGVDVGGDFYDIVQIDGDRWLLVVGDVCGKGIEAASVTGIARHTIRAVAASCEQPSEVLRHLNQALRRTALEHDVTDTEPQFATVCAVVIDLGGAEARGTACCAGHPLPLVRRSSGSVAPVGRPGMAVGIFDDPALVDEQFELRAGDALVCLTDGILERRRGRAYFEDTLPETLAGLPSDDASRLAARLRAEAEGFSIEPPADDMAVLVLRVPPEQT